VIGWLTAMLELGKTPGDENVYRFLYSIPMKTTLDIDDELLVRAKAASARERKSLTALIEEGLRLRLRRRPGRKSPPVAIAVHRASGGLVPGVDPLSNRSLLDAADDDT
jgi:hypothetical protein